METRRYQIAITILHTIDLNEEEVRNRTLKNDYEYYSDLTEKDWDDALDSTLFEEFESFTNNNGIPVTIYFNDIEKEEV